MNFLISDPAWGSDSMAFLWGLGHLAQTKKILPKSENLWFNLLHAESVAPILLFDWNGRWEGNQINVAPACDI